MASFCCREHIVRYVTLVWNRYLCMMLHQFQSTVFIRQIWCVWLGPRTHQIYIDNLINRSIWAQEVTWIVL